MGAVKFLAGLPNNTNAQNTPPECTLLWCSPGPRLVDALEFLVGLLNNKPELIPAGFPWFYYKPSEQAATAVTDSSSDAAAAAVNGQQQ